MDAPQQVPTTGTAAATPDAPDPRLQAPPGEEPCCAGCGCLLWSGTCCRECGRSFDPADPATYAHRPPFQRWRFEVPRVLLAAGGGLLLFGLAAWLGSWGYGATFAVPFALGCFLAYELRVKKAVLVLLGLTLLVGLLTSAITLSIAGLLCSVILAVIAVGPLLIGMLAGWGLRVRLKQSRFSQRWYLPLLLCGLTAGIQFLEHRATPPAGIEVVETVRVLDLSPGRAWDSLVFYEEVRLEPPWLARVGLPHPLSVRGRSAARGDLKVCVYDSGHLTKRITTYLPGRLLAFEVIEQRGIEDRSVRLVGGAFRFAPVAGGRTRVTLTTEYRPLLAARLFWRPWERLLTGVLHHHVLDGIQLEGARGEPTVLAAREAP